MVRLDVFSKGFTGLSNSKHGTPSVDNAKNGPFRLSSIVNKPALHRYSDSSLVARCKEMLGRAQTLARASNMLWLNSNIFETFLFQGFERSNTSNDKPSVSILFFRKPLFKLITFHPSIGTNHCSSFVLFTLKDINKIDSGLSHSAW